MFLMDVCNHSVNIYLTEDWLCNKHDNWGRPGGKLGVLLLGYFIVRPKVWSGTMDTAQCDYLNMT